MTADHHQAGVWVKRGQTFGMAQAFGQWGRERRVLAQARRWNHPAGLPSIIHPEVAAQRSPIGRQAGHLEHGIATTKLPDLACGGIFWVDGNAFGWVHKERRWGRGLPTRVQRSFRAEFAQGYVIVVPAFIEDLVGER